MRCPRDKLRTKRAHDRINLLGLEGSDKILRIILISLLSIIFFLLSSLRDDEHDRHSINDLLYSVLISKDESFDIIASSSFSRRKILSEFVFFVLFAFKAFTLSSISFNWFSEYKE